MGTNASEAGYLLKIDKQTGKARTYKKVVTHHSGAPMSDALISPMYPKDGDEYFVDRKFISKNIIYVEDFGVVGDGVADDTLAIQNAFDAAWQMSNNSVLYNGTCTTIVFPAKIFKITSSITINIAYVNVLFNGAIFIPSGSLPSTADYWAFNFTYFWKGSITDLKMKGFKKPLRIFNPNSDTGCLSIDGLDLEICGTMEINARSSELTISNYRFNYLEKLYVKQCDKLHLTNGWVTAPVFTKIWDAMFVVDHFAIVTVTKTIFRPTSQTLAVNKLAWFKNMAGIIKIEDCQFGAEDGRMMVAMNLAPASASGRGFAIEINNTQAFCSEQPWILLLNMPDRTIINNWSGTLDATHTYSIVSYCTDENAVEYNSTWPIIDYPEPTDPESDPEPYQMRAVTFGSMLTTVPWPAFIKIMGGATGELFTKADWLLFRFLVGSMGERYSYYSVAPGQNVDLLFDNKQNSANAWQVGNQRMFKVTVSTPSGNGIGRWAQYIVHNDNGTRAVEVIKEFSEVWSPRVFIESGIVRIGMVGGSAAHVFAKVEILTCNGDAAYSA